MRQKTQTRRHSALEALTNVAVGYGVAVTAQIIIFPLYGLVIPLHDNLTMGGIFTVISLIRSYALRRLFNRWHQVKGLWK
jgi:hypothetical protein